MTSRAGDLLAEILDNVSKSVKPNQETQSTEDVLSALEDAASWVEDEGEEVGVTSGDAVSLYHYLDIPRAAEMAGKTFVESDVRIENVNYGAAILYLAVNMTPAEIAKEGLENVVNTRKRNRGRKPGLRGSESTSLVPWQEYAWTIGPP